MMMEWTYVDDAELPSGADEQEDSVLYWNFMQPQVDGSCHAKNENEDEDEEEEDEQEYDILYPSSAFDSDLSSSEYYRKWMKNTSTVTVAGETLCSIAAAAAMQRCVRITVSLVRRFTDFRFNWETQTLRSFLEMVTWCTVMYKSYTSSRDVLSSLQLGFIVGMFMSICDELLEEISKAILRYRDGCQCVSYLSHSRVVQRPEPKSRQTVVRPSEISLLKTIVFGYVGAVCLKILIHLDLDDVHEFAGLLTAANIAVMLVAELFCQWTPTRRIGFLLQTRWTNVVDNWQSHAGRSCLEVSCWFLTMWFLKVTTGDLSFSMQVGTVTFAVALSILNASNSAEQESTEKKSQFEDEFVYPTIQEDKYLAWASLWTALF